MRKCIYPAHEEVVGGQTFEIECVFYGKFFILRIGSFLSTDKPRSCTQIRIQCTFMLIPLASILLPIAGAHP